MLIVLLLLLGVPGLTGGNMLLVAACASYISDVTTEENLLLRMAVSLLSPSVGIGITQLAIGYLIDDYGFGPALWMSGIAYLVVFLYIIIPPFLIETVDRKGTKTDVGKSNPLSGFKSIILLFKNNTYLRRWRLALLNAIEFMNQTINTAALSIALIYGLGPPFCWSSILVAGYSTTVIFTGSFGKYGKKTSHNKSCLHKIMETVSNSHFVK